MSRWIICVFTGALLCLATSQASADRIQTLSKRLSSGSDKVRISAALSLAKSKDSRAIQALSRSLAKDRSAAIRRISAASLGQRLQQQVSNKVRRGAIAALKKASIKDRDAKVRTSAKVALTKASMGNAAASSKTRTKGVLVAVATPKKLSRRLPRKTASMMQKAVRKTIRDKAPSFVKTAPGTTMPSSSQLKKSGMAGFSVEPNLSKLKLVRSGRRVTVQCEVKMRVMPWATKGESLAINNSATVTGSASVTSSNSSQAIADSSQACISAVVTQVTSNQIVPFLAAKVRQRPVSARRPIRSP